MEIIDGKKLQIQILKKVKDEVASLPFVPVFCDVLVGEDKVSTQYVRMKARMGEGIGINFYNANFLVSVTTEELVKEIKLLNKVPNMSGIIVQLPLPPHINQRIVLDAIDPHLDIDCLGSTASAKFYKGENTAGIGFPTAFACMALLDSLNLELKSKKIVVMGQGELVGKPVVALLHLRGLNPTIIISQTENTEQLLKEADVVISGIGHGRFIQGDMIKNGVVIIDAGTSESNSAIVGDVDLESVREVAGYVSPVPGGVGPVTIAMLLKNILEIAKFLIETQNYFVK